MGRKKTVFKRYLIGLDETQSNTLEGMANLSGMTYSEVVSLLLDYYQLGEADIQPKKYTGFNNYGLPTH